MVIGANAQALNKYIQHSNRFVPEVNPARCVHAKINIANCKACVDVCPHSAWQLNSESLTLAVDSCSGCGLCVGACPEAAINYEFEHIIKSYKDYGVALLSCEQTDTNQLKPTTPCLHSIGIFELLRLYQQGVRLLAVTNPDCDACVYGTAVRLKINIASLNKLLESRGRRKLKVLELNESKSAKWRATLKPMPELQKRRGFMKRAFRLTTSTKIPPKQPTVISMSSLLPENIGAKQNIYPFAPKIKEDKCNGCTSCVKVCPHQAIVLNNEQRQLEINPENCTGCRMCMDICAVNSISLNS